MVEAEASAVVNKLVAYVKNGYAVIAGLFSSFGRPLDMGIKKLKECLGA